MLNAANVLIDRQPMIGSLIDHRLRLRAAVARVVPRRLDKGIEGIGFALGGLTTSGTSDMAPVRIGLKRRAHASEFNRLGQGHRQIVIGHRHRAAGGAMNNRNGTTPIALPGYAPVTQSIVDPPLTDALRLKMVSDGIKRGVKIEPRKRPGIDGD
jgi:hypothetical protein